MLESIHSKSNSLINFSNFALKVFFSIAEKRRDLKRNLSKNYLMLFFRVGLFSVPWHSNISKCILSRTEHCNINVLIFFLFFEMLLCACTLV